MAAFCSVCKKKDRKSVPIVWCTECQKALCSTCSHTHKQQVDHDTLPYSDYLQLPPFIKTLNQTCSVHREKCLYLCREHDQLICNKCLQTKHNKCRETPVVKDVIGKVKTSNALENVICEVDQLTDILQNGTKKLQNILNGIQNQRKELARNVEDNFEMIMKELKKLKNSMLSDIDETVKTNEINILKIMEKINTMKEGLKVITVQKQSIEHHATNLQTYFGIKKMEEVVVKTRASMTELSGQGALNNVEIRLGNPKMMSLEKTKLFGEINVTKTPINMSLETSKSMQAQSMTPQNQIQLQQTVDLGLGGYWSCCALSRGLIAVTDFSDYNIKLINPEGKMTSTVELDDSPYGVAVVDDNLLVVLHPTAISLIDFSRKRVEKSWPTDYEVSGISYRDGHAYFCKPQTGIMRLDIDSGAIDNVIFDENVDKLSQVVVCDDRICYTCDTIHTVTVFDVLKHAVIFKFKDETILRNPIGITVDRQKNIYVTGHSSHNVLSISPDGKRVRQLLSKREDQLYRPTGIYYDSHNEQLTVITKIHATLCKYKLG